MFRKNYGERCGFYGVAVAIVTVLIVLPVSSVMAQNPYLMADNSWISIQGTVEDVQANRFTLDYGDGSMTVEMDDGDRDADGYKLSKGDKVMVNGIIDDDLFESKKIEASSVHVEKLNTTFFASAFDEEDFRVTFADPVIMSSVMVEGRVVRISGEDEFILNTGHGDLRVEVEDMIDNPLDNTGYLRVEDGDYIRVYGAIDDDFFEGRELVADSVIKILDFEKKHSK